MNVRHEPPCARRRTIFAFFEPERGSAKRANVVVVRDAGETFSLLVEELALETYDDDGATVMTITMTCAKSDADAMRPVFAQIAPPVRSDPKDPALDDTWPVIPIPGVPRRL
jgi:hypothetical protein